MIDRIGGAAEIERMKREIDLVKYAAEQGYERNRAKSCGSSTVMEKDDHQVIIKRSSDDRWYYWSRNDPEDKGAIVDFVAHRRGLLAGRHADVRAVVAELRPMLGSGPPARLENNGLRNGNMLAPRCERELVRAAFAAAAEAPSSAYLVNERALTRETLASGRFRGTWRLDRYGNALFPHHDDSGLCGFEKRGARFRGFATGGRKALWQSNRMPGDRAIVFTESAIDAMSHQQFSGRKDASYASIGGEPSRSQCQFIRAFLERTGENVTVVAAFDADSGGDRFSELLRALTGRAVLRERPEWARAEPLPEGRLDWNRLVQEAARAASRARTDGREL